MGVPRRRVVHHLDFLALVTINREVVSLTSERHEFDESDERRHKALVKEVRRGAGKETFESAVVEEASTLMFRIARVNTSTKETRELPWSPDRPS